MVSHRLIFRSRRVNRSCNVKVYIRENDRRLHFTGTSICRNIVLDYSQTFALSSQADLSRPCVNPRCVCSLAYRAYDLPTFASFSRTLSWRDTATFSSQARSINSVQTVVTSREWRDEIFGYKMRSSYKTFFLLERKRAIYGARA